MSRPLTFAMLSAAAVFVTLSATMNAMFLSSLGRTTAESYLLGTVSVAADGTKAVLPVVIVRAIVARAWLHVAMASVMLSIVIVLSLASGLGFAAVTRSESTAAREARAEEHAGRQKQLRELDTQLGRIADARAVSVVAAEIATTEIDWRWAASKACKDIVGTSARQFCSNVMKLRTEQAAALERQRLATERGALLERVAAANAITAGVDADPQAAVFAQMFGVNKSMPRVMLTTFLAVTIELGSVILILLVSGPALLGWRDPKLDLDKPPALTTIPASKDVNQWRQRRETTSLLHGRSGIHG